MDQVFHDFRRVDYFRSQQKEEEEEEEGEEGEEKNWVVKEVQPNLLIYIISRVA